MVLCGGVGNAHLGDCCSSLPVGSFGTGGTHKFSKVLRSPFVKFFSIFWHAMIPFIRMTLCLKRLLYDAGGLCSCMMVSPLRFSVSVFLYLSSKAGLTAPISLCVIACNLLMGLFLQVIV